MVDLFFGGTGELEVRAEGRDFSAIEWRIIKRVVDSALEDLQASWRPLFPVKIDFSRSEVNPQFVAIVPHSEVVVGEPMEILMEGRLMARGEVILVNERHGIRISEIEQSGEADPPDIPSRKPRGQVIHLKDNNPETEAIKAEEPLPRQPKPRKNRPPPKGQPKKRPNRSGGKRPNQKISRGNNWLDFLKPVFGRRRSFHQRVAGNLEWIFFSIKLFLPCQPVPPAKMPFLGVNSQLSFSEVCISPHFRIQKSVSGPGSLIREYFPPFVLFDDA